MKKYLEYEDEKSHKFWELEVKEESVITRYGKIGTDGRLTEKEFESEEKAHKEAEKQIKAKEKKGYVFVTKGDSENTIKEKDKTEKLTRSEIVKFIEEKTQIKVNYELPSLLFLDSLYAFGTWEEPDDINDTITKKIKNKVDKKYTAFCAILDKSSYDDVFYKIFLFDKKDNILSIKLDEEAESSTYIDEIMQDIKNLEDLCINKQFKINDYDALEKFIEEEMSLDYISTEGVDVLEKITQTNLLGVSLLGDSLSESFKESVQCFIDNGDEFDHLDINDDISEEEAKKIEELDDKYIPLAASFSGDYYQIFVSDKKNNIYKVGYNHDFISEMRYNMLSNSFKYEKLEIYSSSTLAHYLENLDDLVF